MVLFYKTRPAGMRGVWPCPPPEVDAIPELNTSNYTIVWNRKSRGHTDRYLISKGMLAANSIERNTEGTSSWFLGMEAVQALDEDASLPNAWHADMAPNIYTDNRDGRDTDFQALCTLIAYKDGFEDYKDMFSPGLKPGQTTVITNPRIVIKRNRLLTFRQAEVSVEGGTRTEANFLDGSRFFYDPDSIDEFTGIPQGRKRKDTGYEVIQCMGEGLCAMLHLNGNLFPSLSVDGFQRGGEIPFRMALHTERPLKAVPGKPGKRRKSYSGEIPRGLRPYLRDKVPISHVPLDEFPFGERLELHRSFFRSGSAAAKDIDVPYLTLQRWLKSDEPWPKNYGVMKKLDAALEKKLRGKISNISSLIQTD